MFQCPICGKENAALQCAGCGFDGSQDYEGYPTLSPLSKTTESRKSAAKKLIDLLRCSQCGSFSFHVNPTEGKCLCCTCGAEIPLPMAGPLPAGSEPLPESTQTVAFKPYIAAGAFHTIGLRADGTVLATGDNTYGQCNTTKWTDIIAVAAGYSHSVGLKKDGTVVATGSNDVGQYNSSDWHNIVAISASFSHTLGLKRDGTVIATGSNDFGQCDTSDWYDIIAIAAGDTHSAGLKKDGTVVTAGEYGSEACNTSSWTNIITIAAGYDCTTGVKQDGTVVSTNRYISGWKDMAAIAMPSFEPIGLKKDGSFFLCGDYYLKEHPEIAQWADVIAFAEGTAHVVALLRDGTVVAAGRNDEGQCNVSDWKLI